jgi:hypothetical protein
VAAQHVSVGLTRVQYSFLVSESKACGVDSPLLSGQVSRVRRIHIPAKVLGGRRRRGRAAGTSRAAAMDEQEFRRMLDLFPVVRSRDYCVRRPLLRFLPSTFPELPCLGAVLVLAGLRIFNRGLPRWRFESCLVSHLRTCQIGDSRVAPFAAESRH